MTIRQIRRAWSAAPFVPFAVVTVDGHEYPVGDPAHLGRTPSGRRIMIGLADDSAVTLDLIRVTNLRVIRG